MIVAYISDPYLLAAVRRSAHPEEEVVAEPERAEAALALGYPRMVVRSSVEGRRFPALALDSPVPVVTLTKATLSRWDAERRAQPVPKGRIEFMAERLAGYVEKEAGDATWVDRTLADLTRAVGRPLPPPLRTFARRILEFPSYYDDLNPVADSCGMSRGALKARFRRRELPSPYAYVRWLRVMAVAYVLSDRTVTVAQAARRLGFTSDGNLCRTMMSLTGLTPTEVRSLPGWNRLLISFAWTYLRPEAVDAWGDLEDLFLHRRTA